MREELSNGTIKIRRYRAEDVPLLFEAARESTKEMFPWMPWCHPNYSIDESAAFIHSREAAWNQKTDFAFAVFDVASDQFLGGVGLSQIKRIHNFANLGYWVRSSKTRQGIATAATLLAARFGFEDLGLSRIEIVATVGNLASQRVAEKANAKREGVLRNRLLINNQLHDAVMFSLIEEDLKL